MIIIRTTRFNSRKVRRGAPPPWKAFINKTGRFHYGMFRKGRFRPTENRFGADKPFLGRQQPLLQISLRECERRQARYAARIPEDCRNGKHDFNEHDYCEWCGKSIWRVAFCEAP